MTFRVLFLGWLIVVIFCASSPSTASAGPKDGSRNLVVVSIDASAVRSRSTDDPYSQYLAEAHALRFLNAWPLPSIGQIMLVFDGETPLTDAQLAQVAGASRFVRIAQRVQMLTTRAAEPGRAQGRSVAQQDTDELGIIAAHRWSTGKGVRIAIIDTGADRRHPELRPRIVASRDFTGRRMRDFDKEAHGTVVASIIGGARDGAGILGIAPDSELLILRACLQRDADHYNASCDSVSVARALDHAIEKNVQVINLSITGATDPLLATLIEEAFNRGIIVVSALEDGADKRFPGSAPGVLPVLAKGRTRPIDAPAHAVQAPGTEILGALPDRRYGTLTGVSASTAVTSGVVALLLQRKPHMGTGVIVEQLQRSADPESGSIHACRAVAYAIGVDCKPSALSGGRSL